MKPIKFTILDKTIINNLLDNILLKIDLSSYLVEDRKDILEKIDIFIPNARSAKQNYTRFDLFEYDNINYEIIVCPIYLEIFEECGAGNIIPILINQLTTLYPNNIIVFQWNHDNDFSKYSLCLQHIDNFKVINFGYTKNKFITDILVPFWAINTNYLNIDKKYFCSFIGSNNNSLRTKLINNIIDKKDITHLPNRIEKFYYEALSESVFSLCPKGGINDGGFSYRFYECMHLNTIPVIISDYLNFPYDNLNWNKICIRFNENIVDNLDVMIEILKTKKSDDMLTYINNNRNYLILHLSYQLYYYNLTKLYNHYKVSFHSMEHFQK